MSFKYEFVPICFGSYSYLNYNNNYNLDKSMLLLLSVLSDKQSRKIIISLVLFLVQCVLMVLVNSE